MAATVVQKAFCVLELVKTNSVTVAQRHFRRRYGKPPPTRQSICDWSKTFQETGFLCITVAVASVDEDMLRPVWTELDYRIDMSCDKRLAHRTFVTSSCRLRNMYYKTT